MSEALVIHNRVMVLVELGALDEAEQLVDQLANSDFEELKVTWNIPLMRVYDMLSHLYGNIGLNYLKAGKQGYQTEGEVDDMRNAARDAERCFEKALDLFDISADDTFFLPIDYPLNKNLIFVFWGLGLSKYIMEKPAESQKYLQLCLRIRAIDEQAAIWQSDASNYLHKLEKKPAQIVLKIREVIPNIVDSQLMLQVRGRILEWDCYAHPTLDSYTIQLDKSDVFRLEALGYDSVHDLIGHSVTLLTDESGDLFRALRIVHIK